MFGSFGDRLRVTGRRGLLINVEVADVDEAYDRLVRRGGLDTLLELREEAFGQRHFIVADPTGNLVDVIENIPPTAEYADAYSNG